MEAQEGRPGAGPVVVGTRLLVVAASYWCAAEAGLRLALVHQQVTPLWPPTGLALAALLVWGPGIWPAITVAAFLVNLPIGPSLPSVALISVGNTLAPLCAWLLLTRTGFRSDLRRLRDAVSLVFLGALASMLVSATIGTAVLAGLGTLSLGRFWPTWAVWWSGDAMGVLVVTPLLLALRGVRWSRRPGVRRWIEAAGLAVATAATAAVTGWAPAQYHLSFLVFPVLVWAATRFRLAGAAPCALVMSVGAVLAASHGAGPYAGIDLLTTMIDLQAFTGSVALTGLLLAALTAQRDHARQEVEQACAHLTEAVAALQTQWSPLDRLLPRTLNQPRPTPDGES